MITWANAYSHVKQNYYNLAVMWATKYCYNLGGFFWHKDIISDIMISMTETYIRYTNMGTPEAEIACILKTIPRNSWRRLLSFYRDGNTTGTTSLDDACAVTVPTTTLMDVVMSNQAQISRSTLLTTVITDTIAKTKCGTVSKRRLRQYMQTKGWSTKVFDQELDNAQVILQELVEVC